MRVLNLYAGIGGNRKLWENIEVTAVEFNPDIAAIYQDFFPNDKVVVADAHQYLLEHYKEFDFIWASPPCPTHSDIRRMGVNAGQYEAQYPDMQLYQEIILLTHFASKKTKWIIENVRPYYDLLITGQHRGRHIFWANFYIHNYDENIACHHASLKDQQKIKGFDLSKYSGIDKRKTIRNCVDSKLGLHVFNCAFKKIQQGLF